MNTALHQQLPCDISDLCRRLAIGLHLIPYYGTPNEHEQLYLYCSQTEAGTTSFIAYATVYLVLVRLLS